MYKAIAIIIFGLCVLALYACCAVAGDDDERGGMK
jgi:hypothetical protein